MITFFQGGREGGEEHKPHSFILFARKGENFYVYALFYCAYAWQCYVLYTSLVMLMCVDRKERSLENREKDLTTPCNLIYELLFFL